jgi:hypothetical protein
LPGCGLWIRRRRRVGRGRVGGSWNSVRCRRSSGIARPGGLRLRAGNSARRRASRLRWLPWLPCWLSFAGVGRIEAGDAGAEARPVAVARQLTETQAAAILRARRRPEAWQPARIAVEVRRQYRGIEVADAAGDGSRHSIVGRNARGRVDPLRMPARDRHAEQEGPRQRAGSEHSRERRLARHLDSSAHTTSALSGPCPARAGIVLEINELRRYPPDRRQGGQPRPRGPRDFG